MHDDDPSAPAHQPLRVMVVDDHDLFRSGLRRLLEEERGLEVVGESRRGDEAVQRVVELRPDVVVMDLHMPGMSGVEATRALRKLAPHTAVLMLTVSGDDGDALDAILAGASGYLLKDATLPEILRGIRAAAAGEALISPAVAPSLMHRLRRHGQPAAPPADKPKLSPRELDVLRLVVAGCETSEIAKRLHLSASTVKHHVSSTVGKLGVNNRIQAAVLAVRWGSSRRRTSSPAEVEPADDPRVIRPRRCAAAPAADLAPPTARSARAADR